MTFDEYLLTKKIDREQFQQREPERFAEWAALFEQVHPESFTTHKKFLINELRRKYQTRP